MRRVASRTPKGATGRQPGLLSPNPLPNSARFSQGGPPRRPARRPGGPNRERSIRIASNSFPCNTNSISNREEKHFFRPSSPNSQNGTSAFSNRQACRLETPVSPALSARILFLIDTKSGGSSNLRRSGKIATLQRKLALAGVKSVARTTSLAILHREPAHDG